MATLNLGSERRSIHTAAIILFTLLMSLVPVAPVIAVAAPSAAATKPTWTFTIEAAVAQATADRAGGYVFALSRLLTQFDRINHAFNDSGVFKANFAFNVAQSHLYSDTTSDELARPHPATSLKVIYDEDSTSGGWLSDSHTIIHAWPAASGGDFVSDATDALVHEMGHFRGATDEYASDVDAAKNPVNGTGYRAANSVMSYPYGVHNWSPYSVGLINMQGSRTDEPSPALASKSLPPLQVRALSASGAPVKARIRFYPVVWFSYSVRATPSVDVYTSPSTGYYKFTASPYKPASGNPWDLTYSSFLVKATYGGKTMYKWLPIATTSVSYFTSPTTPYVVNIRF